MAKLPEKCHCGELLKSSTVIDSFGPGFSVDCDGCGENLESADAIYQCPHGFEDFHTGAANFCQLCASKVAVKEDTKEETRDSVHSRVSSKSKRGRSEVSPRGRDRGRGRGYGRGHGYARGHDGGHYRGRGRGRPDHYPASGRPVPQQWRAGSGHPPHGRFEDERRRGPPPFQQPQRQHFEDTCRGHAHGGGYHGGEHPFDGHMGDLNPRAEFRGDGHPHGGHPGDWHPHARGGYPGGGGLHHAYDARGGGMHPHGGHPYDGRVRDGYPGGGHPHGGHSRDRHHRDGYPDFGDGRGERVWGTGHGPAVGSSPMRYCTSCKVHVKKEVWYEHFGSQSHFDKMTDRDKAKICNNSCYFCEAFSCKTMGEWARHCMLQSHKDMAAAKKRGKKPVAAKPTLAADLSSAKVAPKTEPVFKVSDASVVSGAFDAAADCTTVFRVCYICAVKCPMHKDWTEHIRSELHSNQMKILKYCYSCKSVVKVADWSRHWLSRAHYDAMDESTRSRVVDNHCRECGVDFHTHGEWTLHLMSESHRRRKEEGGHWRECHFCKETVAMVSWSKHRSSAGHRAMRERFKYCYTCDARVEAMRWMQHCSTQEHFDKLTAAQKAKVVNKECYYCRGAFCKTLGEWTLHCISVAHKSAESKAIARKLGKPKALSRSSSILVPTKFPRTCKLCEVVCSTPSKWRLHESSQEHSRSVHLKEYCVACDRVMRRSEFESHQFSQAHLEQMDEESKNEMVNRWCDYCDDVLCRTQERWILHCMSPEHRHAEVAKKGDTTKAAKKARSFTPKTHSKISQQSSSNCFIM